MCDYALENGDFYRCEHCYEYHYDDDRIEAEDGTTFCCESCAEREGYTQIDSGEWYPEEDVYFCEHCETYVHRDDWNDIIECCTDCEEDFHFCEYCEEYVHTDEWNDELQCCVDCEDDAMEKQNEERLAEVV